MASNGQQVQQQLTEEQRRERKNQADRDRRARQKAEAEATQAQSAGATVSDVNSSENLPSALAAPQQQPVASTPSIMDMKLGDLKAKLAKAEDQSAFQTMALEIFQSIDKQLSAVVNALQGLTVVVENALALQDEDDADINDLAAADAAQAQEAAVLSVTEVTVEEEETTEEALETADEGDVAEEDGEEVTEEDPEPEEGHYILESGAWYKITRIRLVEDADPVYWTQAKTGGAKVKFTGALEFLRLSKQGTPLWTIVTDE